MGRGILFNSEERKLPHGVENHCKKYKFPEERNYKAGGRNNFGEQEEEHGEREENGYRQAHLRRNKRQQT